MKLTMELGNTTFSYETYTNDDPSDVREGIRRGLLALGSPQTFVNAVLRNKEEKCLQKVTE